MNKQFRPDVVEAAQHFIEHYRQGRFAVNDLDLIIDYAISNDPEKARLGTKVFFGHVIEPLSDTFLIQDRNTLERALAHLITRIRLLPQAKELHAKLDQWELHNEKDLLNRIERISLQKQFDPRLSGKVKKVFIPSRVTLGADVLLNSPVIEKMKALFPNADIIFLGSSKNGSLLKGDQERISIHSLQYNRRGFLLNRFLIWLDVIRAIEEETAGFGQEEEFIIVNTDSRLLQSGLLPLLPPAEEETRYYFWRPSIHSQTWKGTSQAEDLLQWLDVTFGTLFPVDAFYPKIHFSPMDISFANNIYKVLNPEGKRFVISMNLGVGGNKEKRVKFQSEIASHFELRLVEKLLADGIVIILDKGYGQEELDQANSLLEAARNMEVQIAEVTEESPDLSEAKPDEITPRPFGLLAFQGSINKFAALISKSDCYIGYDSLGQHLAAALGRDVIAIFSGYHSQRFPTRWKPMGNGSIRLVNAQSGPFGIERQQELVNDVFELYKSLRNK
jgi:ADP-heptose:LPS heptosyltransferase